MEDPYLANLKQSSKDFYLWIRDDSGNVSSSAGPITVTQNGNTLPHAYVTVSNSNTIKFSLADTWNSIRNLIPDPIHDYLGQYLYQIPLSISGAGETFSKVHFGKLPNVIYVQSYNTVLGSNITVINLERFFYPTIIQRIPITNLQTFTISEDGRNLYLMNLLLTDQPLYQRISRYRIQPDGSLVFEARSGPVNQIKYDKLVAGKNQTIYVTNNDYANILRVNGETLEMMPVTLKSYETYNLRFHPNGKFCYQVNPVPSEVTKLEKCIVNASNGDLTFENNVLTTNLYTQFEVSPDGNYMVVILSDFNSTPSSSVVLYQIDPISGNLTEKHRLTNVSYKPYTEFKIDPSSQFLFISNKDNRLVAFIIDQNKEKLIQTNLPFLADMGLNFDIQFLDRSNHSVQTNITHLNQPGFVHGVNDVKYPLPFTSLVGNWPRGYLLSRAYKYNPINLNVQNTDLSYMSCGKQLSNFDENIEIKNDQGVNRIQRLFGNIWNRSITIQNLATDLSFSGKYRLQDISSNCRPTETQDFVGINIAKKRLSTVFADMKLPVGQKPADLDLFTSVDHWENKGNIIPNVYYTTRCIIHVYGCNFIKLDQPAKIFYCEWVHTNKTFPFYKSKAQCAEKEKGVRWLHHLTLITNVDYSLESNWSWDKYQVTDP
ncbi:beta-propeller fold lactonase family protein [Leptospira meyeri]|uniref:beta-propeller fold lactonase family protein n=1 Tax=Leptospira meyeri TaxID=29508 RepID=UPI001FAF5293|nr:beta-propeller fold lactonase family protein [Leptospira meyeri]